MKMATGETTAELWEYTVEDTGTVTVDRYLGKEKVVSVPGTLEDKPVSAIGPTAFEDCRFLQKVILPSGTREIAAGAFSGCTGLQSVRIPESVTVIGEGVFGGLRSLTLTVFKNSFAEAYCTENNLCFDFAGTEPELPTDADRTVAMSVSELTLPVGKQVRIQAETVRLTDEAPKKTKLVWISSDPDVAKVNASGAVTGMTPGTVTVTCALEDREEICSTVTLEVYIPVTAVKTDEKQMTLLLNQETTIGTTVLPEDATHPELEWTSSEPETVTVQNGKITALRPGDSVITCAATDGSGKAAVVSVHVPTFHAETGDLTVSEKTGADIPFTDDSAGSASFQLKVSGNAFKAGWSADGSIHIIPMRKGKGVLTVTAESIKKDTVGIKVTINQSAVYDRRHFPKMDYRMSQLSPERFRGYSVRFTGYVMQMSEGAETTELIISSSGKKDDPVSVIIDNTAYVFPVTVGSYVDVYGQYDGAVSYTTEAGAQINIPNIAAGRINLK